LVPAFAVAYASEKLGLRAEIFVPESTPPAKLEKLQAMSSEVVVEGDEGLLRIAVENLLDKEYELLAGYNTPGLSGYLGLRYSPVGQ
jgi:threonine dehydratase